MMNEEERSLLKAAYVTQLRYGCFTKQQFPDKANPEALTGLVEGGRVEEIRNGSETRYSLTKTGRGMIRVVLAGGVYDVLHVGHLAALTEAKKLGDVLVVVVATDTTVETLKERKPLFPEEDRRVLVQGLKPVDIAILGYEDVGFGFEQILSEVKPDVVAFGYDQEKLERTVAEIIQRHGLKIETRKLPRFEHERYVSSSLLRQKLAEELS
jgi:cytidyltransferase-like protein